MRVCDRCKRVLPAEPSFCPYDGCPLGRARVGFEAAPWPYDMRLTIVTPPDEAAASPKKWYIIKVTSGREESIKAAVERRVKIEGLEEFFGQIHIPVERVTEIKKVKEKYKNDMLAQQQAMSELYRRHGVNPAAGLGGCLMLFAQMPVFLGLYFAMQESFFFRLEPFLWIRNLAAPDMLIWWTEKIPFISDRGYPPELAGPRYPDGIPIYDESELAALIDKLEVDEVAFSYSDVSHEYVMHKASQVLAAGASFVLLGPKTTMLEASVPVVAVCAVRTGCGKSQTTRYLAELLKREGLRVVAVRHPMPYGDLVAERVQRFETLADLDRAKVTIEEREEYDTSVRFANYLAIIQVRARRLLRASERR